MTKLEFKECFDRLVKAFSPTKPQDKADIYFEYLAFIDGDDFKKAVNRWISTGQKFPSISDLKQVHAAINPQFLDKRTLPRRQDVQGSWAKTSVEEFAQVIVDKAQDNPLKFLRGFKKTGWIVRVNHEEKYVAACEVLKELVGEERYRMVMEEPC